MIFEQLLFINNIFIGEMRRGLITVHATVVPPPSYAFFCPVCGDLWARAVIEKQKHTVWHRLCGKHSSPFLSERPGSIWLEWDRPFVEALPDEALRRELWIHLAQAEKGVLSDEC